MQEHDRPDSDDPSSSAGSSHILQDRGVCGPQFSPVLTALFGIIFLATVALFAWLQMSVPRVERVASPGRALSLMVSRIMDLEEAFAQAPAWERFLYKVTAENGTNELEQAVDWYQELAQISDSPSVHLQLAVLQAEAGRLDWVQQQVAAWEQRPDSFPFLARLVRAAYLEPAVEPNVARALQAELAEALPAGWFYDRLAIGLAERSGDEKMLAAIQEAMAKRAAPLLRRVRILTAVELSLILPGVLALIVVAHRRDLCWKVGNAPLPPPWPGWVGAAVLVRGGGMAALLSMAFLFLDSDNLLLRLASMPMIALPLVVMARLYLLNPVGYGFKDGFGLRPSGSGWNRLIVTVLWLSAVGLIGEWAISLLADWGNFASHWTEWFDADLAWGTLPVVVVSLLEFVVVAPVLEEIIFRGLLFGTLRRKWGVAGASVTSASVFAIAHGYGVLGFASVFWSGLLWAWAYEKTASLLPGILAHAMNNLLVCLTLIWLLR